LSELWRPGCSVPRSPIASLSGRTVFTLQTLPACDEPFDDGVGKVAGFSLHAGVAAKAQEGKKLERLCRYIRRPAISGKRLSFTPKRERPLRREGIHKCRGRMAAQERPS
jgi:hypothetical protein